MNVFILDDNYDCMNLLNNEIKTLFPNFNVHSFTSYQDLLKEISNNPNCIIFLDIVMPKISGISLTNLIHKNYENIPVILYSGAKREMFDVYDCFHIYFIEKPFTKEKIEKSMEKAISYLEKNYFSFSFAKMTTILPIASICYFESCGRAIKLVGNQKNYIFYKKLDDVEAKLEMNFLRVSKSFLVNPQFIKQIEKNKVLLKDVNNQNSLKEISISRKYLKKVLECKIFS